MAKDTNTSEPHCFGRGVLVEVRAALYQSIVWNMFEEAGKIFILFLKRALFGEESRGRHFHTPSGLCSGLWCGCGSSSREVTWLLPGWSPDPQLPGSAWVPFHGVVLMPHIGKAIWRYDNSMRYPQTKEGNVLPTWSMHSDFLWEGRYVSW